MGLFSFSDHPSRQLLFSSFYVNLSGLILNQNMLNNRKIRQKLARLKHRLQYDKKRPSPQLELENHQHCCSCRPNWAIPTRCPLYGHRHRHSFHRSTGRKRSR
jgi:hypothetical protein